MEPDVKPAETAAHKKRKKKKIMAAPLYGLKPAVVDAIVDAARADDGKRVRRLIHPLHYSDIADLLERLDRDDRRRVVEATRRTLAPEVLSELDDAVREEVVQQLDTRHIAAAVRVLETDDALEILEDLDHKVVDEVLGEVGDEDRDAITEGLAYPEDSAGRLMQRHFVAVPQSWTVGETIDYMRESTEIPFDFYDIFVIDGRTRALVGKLSLHKLLRTRRPVRVRTLMETDVTSVPASMDQEDVAILFRDRDLVSAPVVDDGKLVGMITVDDIVDVIDEEAEEDLLKLAGLKARDFYQDALATTRSRFTWLGVNLFTAILASAVIGIFAQTIEQAVALAVLMPIVASMGGNAGTQTLTVTVRAIAMRQFGAGTALRFVLKEGVVGLANGILFAIIMGTIAAVWFSEATLGVVIGIAMIANLVVAGLAGALIPLEMDRRGIDPAVASTVILTTVTDVVGFFTFLGLATIILL